MLITFIWAVLITMCISHIVYSIAVTIKALEHECLPSIVEILFAFIIALGEWRITSAIIVIGCIIALTLIRCFG